MWRDTAPIETRKVTQCSHLCCQESKISNCDTLKIWIFDTVFNTTGKKMAVKVSMKTKYLLK